MSSSDHGHRFFEGAGFPSRYQGYTLKTDFRVWLRYAWFLENPGLFKDAQERVRFAIALCYAEIDEAAPAQTLLEGIAWFYGCGESERTGLLEIPEGLREAMEVENERRREYEPALFSLFWDYREVWAGFKGKYGLDLYTVGEMHWWAFSALLENIFDGPALSGLIRARGLSDKEIHQLPAGQQNSALFRRAVTAVPKADEGEDDG